MERLLADGLPPGRAALPRGLGDGPKPRGSAALPFRWHWVALGLAAVLPCGAAVFTEEFSSAPTARGWRTFGDASLFHWNSTNQWLEVTWDSARPNSYFHRPLGDILRKSDDFSLTFDLRLDSVQPGINPAKPSTFELAVGYLHLASATNAAFSRGAVQTTRNLVEFDYFPAAEIIDATVSPVIVSSNRQFIPGFAFPLEMDTGVWFHVELRYTSSNQTLLTSMTRNGAVFGPVPEVRLPGSFTDFRVDTVAISSYNDAGDLSGSLWARGVVDSLAVTTPAPPVTGLVAMVTNGEFRVRFDGRAHWTYTLQRSEELGTWFDVQQLIPMTGTNFTLAEPMANVGQRFYRVRAERP